MEKAAGGGGVFAIHQSPFTIHSPPMPFHHFIRETDDWHTLRDETLFANPYLEVHRVTVTSPTRSEPFQWTVTHRKGAAVVVPETRDGKYLLIRQERVPIRATIWEFPAGQIDD